MTTGAPAFEDFIPLLRSGDALISRLALTWQTAATTLRNFSDRGRLWGRISPTTGDGLFELFRRPGLASGDLVAHGTIDSNKVTLTAQNSSGISGTADIPSFDETQTHTFDVIVSYADEQDIVEIYASAADELDSNSKWQGLGTRFENLLLNQKRLLDQMLWSRLSDAFGTDIWGRPLLSYLSDPRQYARVHALMCVSAIYEARASVSPADGMVEKARMTYNRAMQEFNMIKPMVDTNRDSVAEGFQNVRSLIVRRA